MDSPAYAQNLGGGHAPGWRVRLRPTARLSHDSHIYRTNATDGVGRLC
jgi:hypothetical protein